MVKEHSLNKIMTTAEENVEWFFGDWIGTSKDIGLHDVESCCAAILKDLGEQPNEMDSVSYKLIRNLVSTCIADLEERIDASCLGY